MTTKAKLISHYDVSSDNLKEIINIKSIHWSYSEEQHKNWINKNLLQDDLHLLIYESDRLIGYTNLIHTKVMINNNLSSFIGIGNVCTLISGKGHGNILMQSVGDVLLSRDWKGILFCKSYLINYYEKFGWELINQEKIIDNTNSDINIMTYNFNEMITSLHYTGRDF